MARFLLKNVSQFALAETDKQYVFVVDFYDAYMHFGYTNKPVFCPAASAHRSGNKNGNQLRNMGNPYLKSGEITPYLPGPEWLYAWTPDGWLAAKVKAQPPANYQLNAGRLEPREFEDWFNNNQETEWIEWRRQAREDQRPQPLATIIGRYNPSTD